MDNKKVKRLAGVWWIVVGLLLLLDVGIMIQHYYLHLEIDKLMK